MLLFGDRLVEPGGRHDAAWRSRVSAWRRGRRRLRSRWRHEQLSVAITLSAAVHYSFDKVADGETYYGLRAQKTDRAEAAHHARRRQRTRAARGPELPVV